MITITFSCGHSRQVDGSETGNVTCAQCSNPVIAHVAAPMPQFRGHVRGPHAQFEALEPKAVTFEEKK